MSTISARAILKKALQDMGADGLCNPYIECGYMVPCRDLNLSGCIAARKTQDPETGETVYVPMEVA